MRPFYSLSGRGVARAVASVLSTGALMCSALAATKAAPPPKPVPPKLHICLAPAKAEVPNGADAVAAVRDSFTSFLSGPSLSVEPLSARLETQVREEARLNDCRYVLFSTLKHTRKTTGLFGRIAAGAVQNGAAEIAAASRTQGGRVAASATSAGAANVGVATQVRERDQLSFQYKLEDATGQTIVEQTQQRRAQTDGEDLLTPLIQSAAESIVEALKPGAAPSKAIAEER